ncbi:MAG: carbohydrate kinase family protein [Promethearchaeota archaeon]
MGKIFNVICLGAALVDMVAKVERHPLEDDEVFVSDLNLLSGGAAANTAYACAKIGLKSAFIGKIGENDTFGSKIIKDFKEIDVSTKFMKYSKTHRTGSAYVALNPDGDRRIYAHSGAANYLSKEDISKQELKTTDVIFLSSLKNLEPFIEAAKIGKKEHIPVILNPGMLIIDQGFENIKDLLKNIDIFILSKREYSTLLERNREDLNKEDIQTTAKKLLDLGIKLVITTLGEQGAVFINSETSDLIAPLSIDSIVDTTGAGDAFSAGFIYGFIQKQTYDEENLRNSIRIGNFVAGKCIQQLGARNGIPTAGELQSFLKLS